MPASAANCQEALAAITDLQEAQPEWKRHKTMLRLTNDLPFIIAYDDGRKTMAEVAREFSCSKQWVSQVLRRNGIRRYVSRKV